MQRVIVDVDDKYINLVIDLLSNMKENVIKKVMVENYSGAPANKNNEKLDIFHELINKSNNKNKLSMATAIDTDEMVNDGIF